MFNIVKKSFAYGAHQVTLETGEIARQAGGAVLVSMDDTVVLGTGVDGRHGRAGERGRQQDGQTRSGFLSADRRLHRKNVCCGPYSRRLFQARGPPFGEGNPDLATHRPAAAPALPRRLLPRGPDRRDGDVAEPGNRSRHSGHHRRLCRPGDLRPLPPWRSPASPSTGRLALLASLTSTVSMCSIPVPHNSHRACSIWSSPERRRRC